MTNSIGTIIHPGYLAKVAENQPPDSARAINKGGVGGWSVGRLVGRSCQRTTEIYTKPPFIGHTHTLSENEQESQRGKQQSNYPRTNGPVFRGRSQLQPAFAINIRGCLNCIIIMADDRALGRIPSQLLYVDLKQATATSTATGRTC